MTLSCLPIEVLVSIFSYLDLPSIKNIEVLNLFYRDVVKNSSLLQYIAALQASGLQDEGSSLTIQERLHHLKSYDEQWRIIPTEHKTRVLIKHKPSNIYDLSAGVYILGDSRSSRGGIPHTRSLRYLDLAEITKDMGEEAVKIVNQSWEEFDIETKIVDIGLALQEHDLVAIITRIRVGNQSERLQLELKQFSTANDHPAASIPVIALGGTVRRGSSLSIMIEICGPLLLLLLTQAYTMGIDDQLMLFNWMTGTLIVKEVAQSRTWTGFAFLSPEVAVVPNLVDGTLEIFDLNYPAHDHEKNTAEPHQIFRRIRTLALPARFTWSSFSHIGCRSDPNFFGRPEAYAALSHTEQKMAKRTGRPHIPKIFGASPERAIVLFELALGPPNTNFVVDFYVFIIHRSSLLRIAFEEHPNGSPDHDETKQAVGQENVMPWNDWGPANTRWMDDDHINRPTWITTTAGQRQAFMRGGMVYVRDYNPYEVRRVQALLEDKSDGAEDIAVVATTSMINLKDCFAQTVESSLPYVEIRLRNTPDPDEDEDEEYSDVMLDEERLICIKSDEDTNAVVFIDIYACSARATRPQ